MHPEPHRVFAPGTALRYAYAPFRFTGRAAQAVKRLKYQRYTSLIEPLADLIAEAYESIPEADPNLVVPVPIHWSRRHQRGFNQSELLSQRLPNLRPEACRRLKPTPPQAALPPEDRGRYLEDAFQASTEVQGRSILLVDDVITGGHTARACAEALVREGATDVGLLTLCASH